MDDAVTLLNAASCGFIAICLVWAVLSPSVQDGVVIKCGLIFMALGFGSIAIRMLDPWSVPWDHMIEALVRSILLINIGAGIVGIGYAWRVSHTPRNRRESDLLHLDGKGHA